MAGWRWKTDLGPASSSPARASLDAVDLLDGIVAAGISIRVDGTVAAVRTIATAPAATGRAVLLDDLDDVIVAFDHRHRHGHPPFLHDDPFCTRFSPDGAPRHRGSRP